MRKRRNQERGLASRAASVAAATAFRLWANATQRPVDFFAILGAGAISLVIVVNAVFLQSGSHPAPFFANAKPSPVANDNRFKPADPPVPIPVSVRPIVAPGAPAVPQPVVARRNDPIAELIDPLPRVAAVQRALSQYGYGQIKPSGVLDDATSGAIEKFERDHKLPVTGRITDRLMSQLAALVGHPLN